MTPHSPEKTTDAPADQVGMKCPSCGRGVHLYQIPQNLPLFGDVLLQTLSCSHCGFKWSDVMSVEVREPAGYEVHVKKESDLDTKLVRNSSGTVEIPELGVLLEPGPLAEGFLTNLEGLLDRVEGILKIFLRSDDLEQRKAAKERMVELHSAREGKMPFTVRVLDPYGGSALIGAHVKRFALSKKEIDSLKRGVMFTQ